MAKADTFLTVVVGGAAGFGLIVLTSRAWKECHVVVSEVGNGPTLFFAGIPVAMVVNMVLFNAVYRFSRRSGGFVVSLLTAAFAITIASLALFSWAGTPAGLAAPVCPANVPPWWPAWIPT